MTAVLARIVVLLMLLLPSSAIAQEMTQEQAMAAGDEALLDMSQDDGSDVAPAMPTDFALDATAMDAAQRAFAAYYDYRTQGYAHRQTVFRWQHIFSRVIFGVVMLVVAVGLYFSWMQFHAARRGIDLEGSTFEASASGLKVSSPVLGVIILALSLGFFYLYLVHVYPIVDAI